MSRGALALAAAWFLAGCATLPYTTMSPEQLRALATIKDANVTCVHGVYAGALITTVAINASKGLPAGVSVESGCKVTFTSSENK